MIASNLQPSELACHMVKLAFQLFQLKLYSKANVNLFSIVTFIILQCLHKFNDKK